MLVDSPLSLEDIKRIDETGLPSMERHHIRLLAHCLACFKSMAHGRSLGSLPQEKDRLQWCLSQPALSQEDSFVPIFLKQLSSAGLQLERVADEHNVSPLELTLDELIHSSLQSGSS